MELRVSSAPPQKTATKHFLQVHFGKKLVKTFTWRNLCSLDRYPYRLSRGTRDRGQGMSPVFSTVYFGKKLVQNFMVSNKSLCFQKWGRYVSPVP